MKSNPLTRNLLPAVIAVIAGNAIYFLVLWRYLPAAARHEVYRFDAGLLVDFWVCLLCFGLLKSIWRFKMRH